MHQNIRLAGLTGILLAVAARTLGAAEGAASDVEPSTMVVVASDDAQQAGEVAPATVAMRNVPSTAGAPTSLTVANKSRPIDLGTSSHGESKLSVVANQRRQPPRAVVVTDPAVMPASSIEAVDDHRFYGEGPFACNAAPIDAPAAACSSETYCENADVPERYRLQRSEAALASHQTPVKGQQGQTRVTARGPANKSTASRTTTATNSQSGPQVQAASHRQSAAQQRPSRQRPSKLNSPADQLVHAHQLSLSASSNEDYSQIIDLCQQAAKQGLDAEGRRFAANLSAWSYNRRGQNLADAGQAEESLADFQAALEADPNCWRALHNRGVTFAQRGQFAEAFDDICRVIELNPKFAKAYSNRATLYVQAADMENAIADYDQAIKLDAKLIPAVVGRGRVRHIRGELNDALTDLTAAVKLAPKDAEIVCSRADLLADVGRYGEAVEEYARAIELNPRFEHAFRNGAWLLATCPDATVRDANGALAGAKAALNCGYGERHAALDTFAAALANAGRFEEAIGTLNQALEIAPDELQAVYESRLKLYESGKPYRTRPIGKTNVERVNFTEATGK